VRQALGAPQLDLIGVSYGTRVAQQYARRYPAAVRSIVLDSAVPNPLALGSEHAGNLEAALKARFATCTHTEPCRQKFGDPYRSLIELRDRLRRAPQTLTARDPVSFAPQPYTFGEDDLAGTVRLFMYSPITAALLPLSISEALHGNFQPLLGQQQLAIDSVSERLTDGVGLSVACAEDADLLAPRPEDAATLLGNSLLDFQRAGCEVWHHGTRPADFHEPFTGALPTLLLAGEYDPVTPPRYASAIASGLPNSRVLLLKGQGHGVMAIGCAPRLVDEFIEHLEPGRLDARCLEALGDTPAFLDFNGAAP
jgi:pimeloyl-ACP methyl ester carboxylesterase